MKIVIVYSALHTGTKFTCNICHNISLDKTLYKEYDYTVIRNNTRVESLTNQTQVTQQKILEVLEDELTPTIDAIVLQVHQRQNDSFYQSIFQNIPEVPVIIPMRDPLLSINTRIWRGTGTIEKFLSQSNDERVARAKDQMSSIVRLLEVPKNHTLIFPIDIDRDLNERVQALRDILEFANLSIDESKIAKAKDWKPVNPTANGDFCQQSLYRIEDEGFLSIKDAILNNNSSIIQKYLSVELEIMRNMLSPFRERLTNIGCKKYLR
jgi:hypothetical protein